MASTKTFQLSNSERSSLKSMLKKGTYRSVELMRARVLLSLDAGKKKCDIARAESICNATVFNIRNRYRSRGLWGSIYDAPRPGKQAQISPKQRAKITALACSEAPSGYSQWSLRLLADRVVELGIVEQISHEAVRKILKKSAKASSEKAMGDF